MRITVMLVLALAACSERGLDSQVGDLGHLPDQGNADLAGRNCGTRGNADCPTGELCELASLCGANDSGGTCTVRPTDCSGQNQKQPECGCDGVTYANACERQKAGVSLASAGACQNACVAAGGYCQPGDFVQPTCKSGYAEDQAIESANPGVCQLGICCVPVNADCRSTGCGPGTYCDGCLTPTGVDYVCLANGSAC